MARFRYRLQPALDRALVREREALIVYRRAGETSARLRLKLDDCARREFELRGLASVFVHERHDASVLLDVDACLCIIARERHLIQASVRRSEAVAANARAAFEREMRQRSALEALRNGALARWRAREALREEGELDESNARAQAQLALSWKDVA